MCPRVGQGLDMNLQKTETNSKQTTPMSSEIQWDYLQQLTDTVQPLSWTNTTEK